jgi:hypothetical protein
MLEFREVIVQFWMTPVSIANKAMILHVKLSHLPKVLRRWHKQWAVEATQEVTQANALMLQLDQLQDERQLTTQECQVRREAKNKILALAAVRRIRI